MTLLDFYGSCVVVEEEDRVGTFVLCCVLKCGWLVCVMDLLTVLTLVLVGEFCGAGEYAK